MNRINFDGRKSGEDKSVNFSVLSRSKSGDAKVHSTSKVDKDSINTGAGDNLYYSKSKESNGSKQVLIEEISLDDFNDEKVNENKKTEKNIHAISKKKVISSEAAKNELKKKVEENYLPSKEQRSYPRHNSLEKDRVEVHNVKSERKCVNVQLNEESIDNSKRKQSDLIIKKGKVFNMGSGHGSKSTSPMKKVPSQGTDDKQSSCNVSFSKNKRDLFQEKGNADYNTKVKKSDKIEVKIDSENYANFLKQKE